MSEEESNNYWRKVSDEEIILGMEIARLKKSELQRKYIDDVLELKKELEELKEYISYALNLDEMTAIKYKRIREEGYIDGRNKEQQRAEQIIYENYIPKSKIEDKIKELDKMELLGQIDFSRIKFAVVVLQELLESEEQICLKI